MIALKSTQRKASSTKALKASEESGEKESSEDEDEEAKDEITHLAEKISKAWIKRKKKKWLTPENDKKGKTKQSEIICYECKEPRHLRSECPKLKISFRTKAPTKKAMMSS